MKAEYIDHMRSDLSVVNAARVSFKKHHETFDTKSDTKLINYLANHKHEIQVGDIMKGLYPVSWKALTNWVRNNC